MSRHENEDISHLNLPDPKTNEVIYYLREGVAISEEEYKDREMVTQVCAKIVKHIDSDNSSYYIFCNNRTQMYDPDNYDVRYMIRNTWKFRKVSRTVFDLYIKFLKQHYRSLLSQAERGL